MKVAHCSAALSSRDWPYSLYPESTVDKAIRSTTIPRLGHIKEDFWIGGVGVALYLMVCSHLERDVSLSHRTNEPNGCEQLGH